MYHACKIDLILIFFRKTVKCVGKFHFQLLEFDFRFSPFSDLLRYIFPFRKPQVVLKIGGKNIGYNKSFKLSTTKETFHGGNSCLDKDHDVIRKSLTYYICIVNIYTCHLIKVRHVVCCLS
jgi:hypothetical protein